MERTGPEDAAARRRLQAIEGQLRGLEAAVAQGTSVPAAVVRTAVAAAISALDDVGRLLFAGAEAARVQCPRCGQGVTHAATLCEYCWGALTPTARA
jgi:DNA-binding FrmR family transcriptional regulator